MTVEGCKGEALVYHRWWERNSNTRQKDYIPAFVHFAGEMYGVKKKNNLQRLESCLRRLTLTVVTLMCLVR